mmetsp:Transcript_39297/g.65997  ORF Transcript_39297/g.65997 Transcript_39297/m.65997 type:complete len:514 (-) Transcript_39297:322-1863(-)
MGFTEDLDGLASLDESKDADETNLLGRDRLRSEHDVQVMPEDMSRSYPYQKDNDKMLLLAVTLVVIGPLMFGFTLGYTSPITGQLTDETRDFYLSDSQMSFFGALVNIGAMCGAVTGGWTAERFGRCRTSMLASLLFLFGYLLIATAYSYSQLLFGRMLTGVGVGLVSFVTPVYIAEISPPSLRGMLGAANQLGVTVGILFVYLLGIESVGLDWRHLALFGCFPSALLLLATFTVLPETPRWLLSKQQPERAESNLRKIRGTEDVHAEIAGIHSALAATANQPTATLKDLLAPQMRKQMVIGVGMMVLQQFSGINAVVFYSASILADAGIKNADVAALAVGVTQVVMTVVCCWLMDKAGRRWLLMVSTLGMSASAFTMGVYFNIKETIDPATGTVLSLGSLMAYIIFFSLGLGAIPWVLMSEIFPAPTRGLASSMATLVNWSCSFVVTQSFKGMMNTLTPAGAFTCYALELAGTFAFVLVLVPETKGRTLEQIQALFTHSHVHTQHCSHSPEA